MQKDFEKLNKSNLNIEVQENKIVKGKEYSDYEKKEKFKTMKKS